MSDINNTNDNSQKTKKVNKELTSTQICNELKITKYFKTFVLHKYKGKRFNLKEWKDLLSKDGLDIK